MTFENSLLSALQDSTSGSLFKNLEPVNMETGDVIYESGSQLHYVYFPTSAVVSLFNIMEDGASAEIAVVGREGILGIVQFMGGECTPSRAIVQSAGLSFRLKSQVLKNEFDKGGSTMHLFLRYVQALMTQISQTVACNRHHTIKQQLCRCILMNLDRLAPNTELNLTQEMIANMLGVRREGITAAARKLQSARLIIYKRGIISVIDRSGLEAEACECYKAVKKEFDRLLPDAFSLKPLLSNVTIN